MDFRRRALTLGLALLIGASAICGAAALADESTATVQGGGVAKDLSPRTEIYMVSGTAGADYVYYGAKLEPKGGVYYGRVCTGGKRDDGRWGMVNDKQSADESAVSFYYSADSVYDLEYWKYLYEAYSASDNQHVVQINLNFDNLLEDISAYTSGKYDARLKKDFEFLGTRTYPVMLRIGGEMNEWCREDPEGFKKAYIHVAELARKYAPEVALVFSPNFCGAVGIDMDDFYPGDEYVDWVGCSLYYNRYAVNGDTKFDSFYGVNEYGDALLNVQQTVNLSRLHKKPVAITESGSAHSMDGKDVSAFAADRVRRAMAYLPMVYPEIKSVIYSDTDFYAGAEDLYRIYDNKAMSSAFDEGVKGNAVYLNDCTKAGGDGVKYYTKASGFAGEVKGTVTFAAYTFDVYSKMPLVAVWSVDGKTVKEVSSYPYAFELDSAALSPGEHKVSVAFSNGEKKECAVKVSRQSQG